MRRFFSLGLALIIVLALALWMATGVLVIPGNGPGAGEIAVTKALEGAGGGQIAQTLESTGLTKSTEHAVEGPDPALSIAQRQADSTGANAAPRSVRIATFTMRAMPIEVPLRGRTKASAQVSATPETSGAVQEVLVAKGQPVSEGDLLCRLDQGTRAAAVAQAQAALDQAQTAYNANADLRKKGLAAANSGLQLEAALKGAQAALDNANAELKRTEVRARTSGIIQEPLANVGALLGPGQPCATIVRLDPILFVGNVPEARMAYARLGLPAVVKTVTGDTLEGKVTYISSVADPATRSFPIEIELPNPGGKVRDGLTAEATVNLGTAPAHLLPQSVLTLDDDGVLGIRAVEDSKVVFYPVTIVSDTRDGVWVTGLPPRLDVITVGQEYVQAGQTVEAGYGPGDAPDDTPARSAGTPS